MVHWVCEVNARPKMVMIKGGLDRIITIIIIITITRDGRSAPRGGWGSPPRPVP